MLALFAIQEEMTEASKGSALGRYLKRNLLVKSSRDSEHRSLEPAMSFRAIQPHLPRTSNDGQRPQTSNTQKAVVVYDSRGNRLYIRFKATRNSYWNRPYTRPIVPKMFPRTARFPASRSPAGSPPATSYTLIWVLAVFASSTNRLKIIEVSWPPGLT